MAGYWITLDDNGCYMHGRKIQQEVVKMHLHNSVMVAGQNLVVVTCGEPDYGQAFQTYVARDGECKNHHVIREFEWCEDSAQQAAEAGMYHANVVDALNHNLIPTVFGFVDAQKLFEISLLSVPDQTTSPETASRRVS